MQNVIMLSVIMLSVIMLSVVMLNVIMLNVMAPFGDQSLSDAGSSNITRLSPLLPLACQEFLVSIGKGNGEERKKESPEDCFPIHNMCPSKCCFKGHLHKTAKIGPIFAVRLILPGRLSDFCKHLTDRHHIAQNRMER
jgi:hypothetical protein